jgi:Ca-activated chloride channel homolog
MLESGTKKRYASAKDVLQDLQRGTSTISHQIKWLLAVSLLLWGWVSLFNALTPVRQQVSNPTPSVVTPVTPNPQPIPTPSTNGGLFANIEGRQQALTLKHTDVKATVSGNLSRVEVTQSFANPYDKALEAVYKFPLPDDAAVDDMEIIIGDRVIRGSIKKKEEAQKIYNQAKEAGQTAGLLEQERDNVFVQSLANILP